MISSLLDWLKPLRFLQLTVFFVLVLLTLPFRESHPYLNIVVQLLLFNILVVTLSASGSKGPMRWLLMGLWGVGEALLLRAFFFLGPGNHYWEVFAATVCFLLMMLVCVIVVLPYIFQTRQVTLDTIFAAVMAYFFISSIFANFYSLCYLGNPHSFNLGTTLSPDQFYAIYTQMIYFSLVTIVGVGYGDIVPLLPFPRMVSALEGVLGHFYVAVFVGWLVGTFLSQSIRLGEQLLRKEPEAPLDE